MKYILISLVIVFSGCKIFEKQKKSEEVRTPIKIQYEIIEVPVMTDECDSALIESNNQLLDEFNEMALILNKEKQYSDILGKQLKAVKQPIIRFGSNNKTKINCDHIVQQWISKADSLTNIINQKEAEISKIKNKKVNENIKDKSVVRGDKNKSGGNIFLWVLLLIFISITIYLISKRI